MEEADHIFLIPAWIIPTKFTFYRLIHTPIVP